MNLVDVEEDVKAIAHLDFDLTCEVRVQAVVQIFGVVVVLGGASRPCGEPAVGHVWCRGCGRSGLICEPHRAQCVGPTHMVCTICRRSGPGTDVYVFEPLKVTS